MFVGEFLNLSREFAEQDVSIERRQARLAFVQELFDNPNAPNDLRMRAARTSLRSQIKRFRLAVASGDADAAAGDVKRIRRELDSLRKKLSEERAMRKADDLAKIVREFEKGMG